MSVVLEFRSSKAVGRALKIYLAVFAGLWSVALLAVVLRGSVLHQPYPFNTFLLPPSYRFSDFTVYDGRFALWGQGDRFFSMPGFKFDYPPPLLVGQLIFYKLSAAPMYCYLTAVLCFALGAGVIAAISMPKESRVYLWALAAALSTAIFSFPLIFLLDRANIEGLVWFAASLGLTLFVIGRFKSSAIFLALAAAMKIFPGVLLLLFLAKKRYRDFWLSLAALGAFTWASLWLSGPTTSRAAQGILEGLVFLRQWQIFDYKPFEINFDHSLFALVKQVCFGVLHSLPRINALLPRLYLPYGILAVSLFAALYIRFLRRLPVLNQVLALSCLAVTLPYVSYDYTLVHLYAPFAILVFVLSTDTATGALRLNNRQMLSLLLPFAVIFTPQSYLVYRVVGCAAQVKLLALSALVVASIHIPLPSSLFNELHPVRTLLLNLDREQVEVEPERNFA